MEPKLSVVQGGREGSEKGSEAWEKEMRAGALRAARTLNTAYMELARYLWEISDTSVPGDPLRRRTPLYVKWGHSSFGEYAERELGVRSRRADYLKRIWGTLHGDGEALLPPETEERVIHLGWAKVKELVRVLTRDNAAEWIDRAEESNLLSFQIDVQRHCEEIKKAKQMAKELGQDLDEAVEEAKNAPYQAEPTHVVHKRFTFHDDQYENVTLAMQKAKQIAQNRGYNNEGYLLDLICTEFLATNCHEVLDESTKVMMLHRISKHFGLQLVVIDPTKPRGEKVILGYKALEDLASDGDVEG